MSNQQQFARNTNVPPQDSVLWELGDGWKISQQTGISYTALKNVDHDDLRTQLKGQKNTKELVQIGDFYFVCKPFSDGTLACYAYPLTHKDKAEKDMGFAIKALLALDSGNLNTPPKQQQTIATNSSTVPNKPVAITTNPPVTIQQLSKLSQVIEVPYDLQPIEWDDAMSIDSAMQSGLIPLPVKYVGVENWGFTGENGKRTFWYGRIKLVRIQEEDS